MNETVYFNGSLIPLNEVKIPVLDYGFLFGYSLFETMRAYDGKVFCLDEHLRRLCTSAAQLGIPADFAALTQAVIATVAANRVSSARVRLIVTLGEGSLAPDPKSCRNPDIIVFARDYHPYPIEVYQKGWRALIPATRRNSSSVITGIKSSNYLENLLIKQEALSKGLDDAVFLDQDGWVAEGTSSNICIMQNGSLKTPDLESGILPGITRVNVLKIAGGLGIPVQETKISQSELLQSSEVFFTNSMIELMPIVEINGQQIGNGRPGKFTQKISENYRILTGNL